MTGDVDLAQAAALIHRSYSFLQRRWRTLVHDASGQPFPRPFIGGEPGGRPWWRAEAIEAWKAGAASVAAGTSWDNPQRDDGGADAQPANDPRPLPRSDLASALLAHAGG